ncbi:MAG TPA: hypothetical protein PLL53_12030 [Saprospiraceae bacterium]|nr:hypothetical protein [Saprospiraceae bacterium]
MAKPVRRSFIFAEGKSWAIGINNRNNFWPIHISSKLRHAAMKYYWILKYILYYFLPAKNPRRSYFTERVFVWFFICPALTWHFITDSTSILPMLGAGTLGFIDLIISWDDERVHKMYSKISAQRKELNMEFSIVKWSIFLIISTFVLSAIYRLVMSGGIV